MVRAVLFALMVGVFAPQIAQAASWVDNGNGTFSLTVTITVSTDVKNKAEQCRKWDNYRWQYSGHELDASAWLGGLLTGLTARTNAVLYNQLKIMWNRFVSEWVAKNSSTPDVDGLAVTVPASPAAP